MRKADELRCAKLWHQPACDVGEGVRFGCGGAAALDFSAAGRCCCCCCCGLCCCCMMWGCFPLSLTPPARVFTAATGREGRAAAPAIELDGDDDDCGDVMYCSLPGRPCPCDAPALSPAAAASLPHARVKSFVCARNEGRRTCCCCPQWHKSRRTQTPAVDASGELRRGFATRGSHVT